MNQYQKDIANILESECTAKEYQWLMDRSAQKSKAIRLGFVMAHRQISNDQVSEGSLTIDDSAYTINLTRWSKDQLCRAFLLLALDTGNIEDFQRDIETIFKTADNRESQAIYASFSLFKSSEIWKQRATEAIRSNVGLIFDAMAFNNPYPAMHFNDTAWNQVVLKAIFSDKSIWGITGLADRRNERLALTLSDFAHERWAAGRTLPADVWFLVMPYPGERYWEDVDVLLSSDVPDNQEAGYLLWNEHRTSAPEHITDSHHEALQKMDQENIDWSGLKTTSKSN